MTNVLVIGYGSIGIRHARILSEIGCAVTVVSRRKLDGPKQYQTLEEAVQKEKPSYAVIATETIEHERTFLGLGEAGFKGTVLVEKPLFYASSVLAAQPFEKVFVAYNLRFHPALQKLKNALRGERVLSAQVYVGRYLPAWRPETDYRSGYSARKNAGGGVLRDLSHELDYIYWMLGSWKRVTASGGHFSHLEIDSDDIYGLMIETQNCPLVLLQMNYLDRLGRREVVINTDQHTFKVDLVNGKFFQDKTEESFPIERDDTYRAEHEAILKKDFQSLCTFEEGMDIVRFVEAAERGSENKIWVER